MGNQKNCRFAVGIIIAMALFLGGCGRSSALHGTYQAKITQFDGSQLTKTIEFLDGKHCRISNQQSFQPSPSVSMGSYEVINGKIVDIVDTQLNGEIADSNTLVLHGQTYKRIQ